MEAYQAQPVPIHGQQPLQVQPGTTIVAREGCRSNTRFVAFFDMGLSLISVIFSFVWVVAGGAYMHARQGWFIFDAMLEIFALFCNMAEICVACTLYGSSRPTGKIAPEKAVKKLRRWMHFNIFLILFNFCLAILNTVLDNGNVLPDLGKFAISFIRMALVAIVFQYIQELKKVGSTVCRKGNFEYRCPASSDDQRIGVSANTKLQFQKPKW